MLDIAARLAADDESQCTSLVISPCRRRQPDDAKMSLCAEGHDDSEAHYEMGRARIHVDAFLPFLSQDTSITPEVSILGRGHRHLAKRCPSEPLK